MNAYAVVYRNKAGEYALGTLCKSPECAVDAVGVFEGREVLGMATIAVESEPVSGMRYRLRAHDEPRYELTECPCCEATCAESWEPGCGLGASEEHVEVAE